jgi:hypothetical protein
MCGTELKAKDLRDHDYYSQLKIPEKKIVLELSRRGTFMGFPFFLQRIDPTDNILQTIVIGKYPKARRLFVQLPATGHHADWSKEIELTESTLNELLSQGFVWFHESEKETLW